MIGKFKQILNLRQQKQMIVLMVMKAMSAGLDVVGISLVYPVLRLMTEPDTMERNPLLSYIYEILSVSSYNDFMLLVILAIILFYVLKNVFQYFTARFINYFVINFNYEMCDRLLYGYMRKDYEYHTNANSSVLIRKINVDVTNIMGLITNFVSLFSDFVLFLFITVVLLILYPVLTLAIIAGMLIFSGLYYFIYGKKVKKIGTECLAASQSRTKWLLQSLDGIKDIKMKEKERYFSDNVKKYTKEYFDLFKKQQNITLLPPYLIETVCISFILVSVIIATRNVDSMAEFIAAMGVFVLALFKVFPRVASLNVNLTNISFGMASLESIVNDLKSFDSQYVTEVVENIKSETIRFRSEIRIQDVSFSYKNTDSYIIRHITFDIKKGDYIGFIGESGVGKTTLIDIVLGILKPTSGSILMDGEDIRAECSQWKKLFGYVPQNVFVFDDTLINNIVLGDEVTKDTEERVFRILKAIRLDKWAAGLPDGIYTEIGEKGSRISGGQRQRLGIARVLYNNPEILVFDEATSALDNDTEQAIMDTIKKLRGRKTILVIAHRLTTIKQCDVIYEIKEGGIYRKEKSELGIL